MRYTALLKTVAKQLGHEVLWSPPQLVTGSINPPPSLRYPGLTCYMARVRVGPREYTGFGRTAVAARRLVEYKAYVDLYFHLQEGRARERESISVSDSPSSDHEDEEEEDGSEYEAQSLLPSQSPQVEEVEDKEDQNQHLVRFAHDCHVYFTSVREERHCHDGVRDSETAAETTGEDGSCEHEDTAECVHGRCLSWETSSPRCDSRREEHVAGGNSSTELASTSSETGSGGYCSPESKDCVGTSGKSSDCESANTARLVLHCSLRQNPIGQLQELLMQQGLPLPTYQFSSSSQSQNGMKTYQCVVHTNGFVGTGQGWKKGQAKRDAAVYLLTEMEKAGINILPVPKAHKKAIKRQPPHLTTALPPPPPPFATAPPPPTLPSLTLPLPPLTLPLPLPCPPPHPPTPPPTQNQPSLLSNSPPVTESSVSPCPTISSTSSNNIPVTQAPICRPHLLAMPFSSQNGVLRPQHKPNCCSESTPVSRPHLLPHPSPSLSVLPPSHIGILRPRYKQNYCHSEFPPRCPVFNPGYPTFNPGHPILPLPVVPPPTFPGATHPILPPTHHKMARDHSIADPLHSYYTVGSSVPESDSGSDDTAPSHTDSRLNSAPNEVEGSSTIDTRTATGNGSGIRTGNGSGTGCTCGAWNGSETGCTCGAGNGSETGCDTVRSEQLVLTRRKKWTPDLLSKPNMAPPQSLPPHPLVLQMQEMQLAQSSTVQGHNTTIATSDSFTLPTSRTFTPATSDSFTLPTSRTFTPATSDNFTLPTSHTFTPATSDSFTLPTSHTFTPATSDSFILPTSHTFTPATSSDGTRKVFRQEDEEKEEYRDREHPWIESADKDFEIAALPMQGPLLYQFS